MSFWQAVRSCAPGIAVWPVNSDSDSIVLFGFMVFFALLFGSGRSPFTTKPTYAGRTVGVVFRGHHQGPLHKRWAWEGETEPKKEKKNPKPKALNRRGSE